MRGWAITSFTTKTPVFRSAARFLQCGLALCLLLAASQASALGLGAMKVRSALNEPLNAEISILTMSRSERRTLKVRLASSQEFAAAGVERPFFLTKIKFTVAKRLNGTYFIQLRTHEPIREPFIHFLVHLEWAGGQLNREYSALIDPPYMAQGKPGAIQTPKTTTTTTRMDDTRSTTVDTGPAASSGTQDRPKKITLATSDDSGSKPETKTTGTNVEKLTDDAAGKTADTTKATDTKTTDTVTDTTVPGDSGTGDTGFDTASTASDTDTVGGKKVRTGKDGWPTHDDVASGKKPDKKFVSAGTSAPAGSRFLGWARMSEYRVRRGDMMWNIARNVRADTGLSLSQVTLAIYNYNRSAFFGNNVNNLKAGRILRMPDRDDIIKLGRKQARSKFFAQYNVWQQHQVRVAQAKQPINIDQGKPVADKPVAKKTEPVTKTTKSAAATKTTKKAAKPVKKDTKKATTVAKQPDVKKDTKKATKPATKDKKTATVAKQPDVKKTATPVKKDKKPVVVAEKKPLPKNLLQIVRNTLKRDKTAGKVATADSASTAKKDKEKEKQAMLAKADRAGESIDAIGQKNKEIGTKSAAVQKQIKKQEKLITIESKSLAKPGDKKATDTPKVDTAKKDTPKADTKKADTKKDAANKPDDKKTAGAAVAKKGPVKKPLIKKPPVKVQPQVAEKSFFETLLDDVLANKFILYIAGGVLGVILLGGLMMYMRRRRSLAEFHESILNTGEATADSGTLDSEGQAISTGDTSFLSDFSQGGMGNIHTDEVDPVAEAEVYLAYGRDEQAEEILKEAIVKSPDRHELRVKLLEIYSQRGDVDAFETLAEELYAALEGRAGPPWDQVEEMGRKLNPENPMFRGGRPASMEAPKTELNQPESDAGSLFTETTPDAAETAGAEDAGMDFDLDFGSTGEASASVEATAVEGGTDSEEVSGIDFDGGLDMSPADTSPNLGDTFPDAEAAGGDEAEGLGLGDTLPDTEQAAIPDTETEDSGISFDLGEDSGDVPTVDDAAVEMSLDLGDDETSISQGSDFSLDLGDDETSIAVEGGADAEIDWEDASGGLDIDEGAGIALDTDTATETEVAADDGEGSVQQWDETATKLDLAKAYIDMGDAEGARSILDEVMAEGNDAQKQQASELAAQIS